MTQENNLRLTEHQRRAFRASLVWWIKWGFLPDEAQRAIYRKITPNSPSATTASVAKELRENRQRLISKLKSKGFTERDIFNFLMQDAEVFGDAIDRQFENYSPPPFTPVDMLDIFGYTDEVEEYGEIDSLERSDDQLVQMASEKDWARDRDIASENFYELWLRYRVINPGLDLAEEDSSRFHND